MVDDQMIGCVTAYYEDGDLKRWLEVGIIIYQSHQWQKGIGKAALSKWIDQLWKTTDLPHLGLTTWSGNTRMIHLAESLGMKQEACVRKVRYWQDQYWDSVKYGILRKSD
ncbi:hypothetical protein XA3_17860 [Xylocopilactobacillus apicola]|uniref:N-acetyltransferase domain-containing protein n=1 Tax=Xylocopilactobacillus apicola TaxID=2932184 RepID=A0AAU9DAD3_9LACO|nr:GNAT family protein [Xylocopilactobacillus apicola]BDR59345.1 hypothetical protein XA3_17860 [Xylocopilactobacillus apicola]